MAFRHRMEVTSSTWNKISWVYIYHWYFSKYGGNLELQNGHHFHQSDCKSAFLQIFGDKC